MLEKLKEEVYLANLKLKENKLIKLTWGNVSGIDRNTGLFVIKPSGVDYDEMSAQDMVVCDLDGNVVEGSLKPSSDTATHIELYKRFPDIGGIAHTHSVWATSWAQAGLAIPILGTTHADTFASDIPCARYLSKEEVDSDYEKNTGKLIIETFEELRLDVMNTPAILLQGHAPFTWGQNASEAVENSIILEEVAKMALLSHSLNENLSKLPKHISKKHYLRKHGEDAYYGQK